MAPCLDFKIGLLVQPTKVLGDAKMLFGEGWDVTEYLALLNWLNLSFFVIVEYNYIRKYKNNIIIRCSSLYNEYRKNIIT